MYIPPGGGDVRPPLGKPNAEILPQTFESGNHEPNCHGSKNGRNCFFRKKRTHVSCHYTQRPGPSSQTGVEVVCNAFTTKVQNWTFFMSELIHCLSTFMSVSPRPIFCAVRGGPCRTPAQPSAATSAALPYLRKTAKIRRSSGGPRLSRPREGWADARERDPPVSPQNPSPASDRDKRGPPVSSQNRKDSPVFGNAALPYLRKTAKIRRFSGGPRLSRPREGWAASGG